MSWNFSNFSKKEFVCQHCGKEGIKIDFVKKLQILRDIYGKPIKISSAYRCPKHPIEASKKSPGSHTEGTAVDILVDRKDAYELLNLAFQLKFKGIGVNQKGSKRFIHLDESETKVRPTVWSY